MIIIRATEQLTGTGEMMMNGGSKIPHIRLEYADKGGYFGKFAQAH